jgi:hypothetical protein
VNETAGFTDADLDSLLEDTHNAAKAFTASSGFSASGNTTTGVSGKTATGVNGKTVSGVSGNTTTGVSGNNVANSGGASGVNVIVSIAGQVPGSSDGVTEQDLDRLLAMDTPTPITGSTRITSGDSQKGVLFYYV